MYKYNLSNLNSLSLYIYIRIYSRRIWIFFYARLINEQPILLNDLFLDIAGIRVHFPTSTLEIPFPGFDSTGHLPRGSRGSETAGFRGLILGDDSARPFPGRCTRRVL